MYVKAKSGALVNIDTNAIEWIGTPLRPFTL